MMISARNQLKGTIVDIEGRDQVADKRQAVTAVIKANDVMVGVD